MDIILFQRISGGWDFLFTDSDGMIYRGFHREPTRARARLLRQLGWDKSISLHTSVELLSTS